MDKGTMWEFGNARWSRNPTQLPAFPFSNSDDAEKRLGFDGCEEIGIVAAATAVDVVKGR